MKQLIISLLLILMLAACSPTVETNTDNNEASFSIEVTGAFTANLNAENMQGRIAVQDTSNMPPMTMLVFNGDYGINIMFFGGQPPEAGTYPIVDFPQSESEVSAAIVEPSGFNSTHVEGTVTLERDGDNYSGEFEIDSSGADSTTVEIRGTFENFVLIRPE